LCSDAAEDRKHRPSVDPSAVIAPNAALVGDVRIGARCVIGYGASLIAEGQPITLGEQVIVRDNAVIRSAGKYPVEVGNAVLIGPHTALFGCTIEDEVFLATGTRVFHLAVVRKRVEVRVNVWMVAITGAQPAASCGDAQF
jgi:carbonic anhydrase/acetyltransferase-like protein (isoleucine patch superfamily)